jgi:hypothetical protein
VGWHQNIGALVRAGTICLDHFERTSSSARASAYETNFSITARHPAQLLNGLRADTAVAELLAAVLLEVRPLSPLMIAFENAAFSDTVSCVRARTQ